jgi:iron complex transport system substrate-binding protein
MNSRFLKQRALFAAITAFILITTVSAIGTQDTLCVVDQTGRIIDVPQPVERIVSAYGIATYYVYALGAGDRIVNAWYVQIRGISQAPEGLHRIEPNLAEKLSFGIPNLEEVVAKEPDLVLTNPVKHGTLAATLAELGIPAIQYTAETPKAIKEAMLLTGTALGPETTARAEAFADTCDRVLDQIRTQTDAIPSDQRLRAYFCGSDPLRVASGDMYQSLMIEAAGGISVSQGLVGYWNNVNLEQVLVWEPDVIVITTYGGLEPEGILNDPDWQAIPAVKNGRVYKIPGLAAAWDTPVPDSILGILWLAERLYPEEVSFDLEEEVRNFYGTFYDCQLSDEEIARLLGE